MRTIPRILITTGEPAGIGPDILLQIAQQSYPAELIVIGDKQLLMRRARLLDLPLTLDDINLNFPPKAHQPGTLKLIPIGLKGNVIPGQLNVEHADYVIRTLTSAASLMVKNKADALVTGPVHKEILNEAGMAFSGHTEFFADYCKMKQTVMLFVVDALKVALATTHIPLAKVPRALTKSHLQSVLRILHAELQHKFSIDQPRIIVCGLNPHAGEGGYLGKEEIDTIIPALDELREEGYTLLGPLPADTVFTQKNLEQADAILGMYHDQVLPVVKHIGFSHAVNVTLGLPFIRTSVDHGTALDIAGTKTADAGSLDGALQLAIQLAHQRELLLQHREG